MRRSLAAFAVVALFAALPAVAAPTVGQCEPQDASGTAATATPIGTPAACVGELTQSDADFYKFDVASGQNIELQVVTGQSDVAVLVSLISPLSISTPCPGGRCSVSSAAGGTWRFGIVYGSAGGPYAVALAVESTTPPPPPSQPCAVTDAPNTPPGAPLSQPLACQGSLTAGDQDWYSFDVASSNAIAASLVSSPSGAATITLRDPSGASFACSNAAASTCTVPWASAGTWNLGVVGASPEATADYTLSLAVAPSGDTPSSCEDTGDAGATDGAARERPAVDGCSGRLSSAADVDVYSFDIQPGMRNAFAIAVAPAGGSALDVSVHKGSDTASCSTSAATTCSSTDASQGKWFVRIARSGPGNVGTYALVIASTGAPTPPPAPETSCETAADAPNAAPGRPTDTPAVCTGNIASPTDEDWYAFQVGAGDAIAVALTRNPTVPGGSATLKLRDGNSNLVSCANDAASACVVPSATAGTWHLVVTARTAGTANSAYIFALVLAAADPLPNTCEPPELGDAGSTTGTARARETNSACIGKIGSSSDIDVYRFNVSLGETAAGAFEVNVVSLNGSTYVVTVFDESNQPVTCAGAAAATACINTTPHAGAYFVKITPGAGAPGPYGLTIAAVSSDAGSIIQKVDELTSGAYREITCETTDAGSTSAAAGQLPWRSSTQTMALCRGSVEGADTVDVYKFRVYTDTATVRVLLQPLGAHDLTLSLTPPPSACEASERINGQCPAIVSQVGREGMPDYVERAVSRVAKSGDWLITIGRAFGGPGGPYMLGVHAQNG